MNIGGFQKFSLIDYPDKISAVIFTQGCNFRCCYCHNPQLVDPLRFTPPLQLDDILSFLSKRVNELEGVVISGGEPTIYKDLPDLISEIKNMGYPVKLDTNGTNPELLEYLLKNSLLDYVAMDIKAPLDNYLKVTGVLTDTQKVKDCISILSQAPVKLEFRTTVLDFLFTKSDLIEVANLVPEGAKFYLQEFHPGNSLNKDLVSKRPLSTNVYQDFSKWASSKDFAYNLR